MQRPPLDNEWPLLPKIEKVQPDDCQCIHVIVDVDLPDIGA